MVDPVLFVFILSFKIIMYWSSADFSGSFRLNGESRKTFISVCLHFFLIFDSPGGGGGCCGPAALYSSGVRPCRIP